MNRKWLLVESAFNAWSDEVDQGIELLFKTHPFLNDFTIIPAILEFPEEEKEYEIRSEMFVLNFMKSLEEWQNEAHSVVQTQSNFFDDTPFPED